ncbi:hypothetical protein MMPV_003031 [Pyropia vietnamensis]
MASRRRAAATAAAPSSSPGPPPPPPVVPPMEAERRLRPIAAALSGGSARQALKLATAAAGRHPGWPAAVSLQAVALARLGRTAEAIRAAARLREAGGLDAGTARRLAGLYDSLAQPAAAAAVLAEGAFGGGPPGGGGTAVDVPLAAAAYVAHLGAADAPAAGRVALRLTRAVGGGGGAVVYSLWSAAASWLSAVDAAAAGPAAAADGLRHRRLAAALVAKAVDASATGGAAARLPADAARFCVRVLVDAVGRGEAAAKAAATMLLGDGCTLGEPERAEAAAAVAWAAGDGAAAAATAEALLRDVDGNNWAYWGAYFDAVLGTGEGEVPPAAVATAVALINELDVGEWAVVANGVTTPVDAAVDAAAAEAAEAAAVATTADGTAAAPATDRPVRILRRGPALARLELAARTGRPPPLADMVRYYARFGATAVAAADLRPYVVAATSVGGVPHAERRSNRCRDGESDDSSGDGATGVTPAALVDALAAAAVTSPPRAAAGAALTLGWLRAHLAARPATVAEAVGAYRAAAAAGVVGAEGWLALAAAALLPPAGGGGGREKVGDVRLGAGLGPTAPHRPTPAAALLGALITLEALGRPAAAASGDDSTPPAPPSAVSPSVTLLLVRLYGAAGAPQRAWSAFRSLDVKHVQVATLSHMVLPGLAAAGAFDQLCVVATSVRQFRAEVASDGADGLARAFGVPPSDYDDDLLGGGGARGGSPTVASLNAGVEVAAFSRRLGRSARLAAVEAAAPWWLLASSLGGGGREGGGSRGGGRGGSAGGGVAWTRALTAAEGYAECAVWVTADGLADGLVDDDDRETMGFWDAASAAPAAAAAIPTDGEGPAAATANGDGGSVPDAPGAAATAAGSPPPPAERPPYLHIRPLPAGGAVAHPHAVALVAGRLAASRAFFAALSPSGPPGTPPVAATAAAALDDALARLPPPGEVWPMSNAAAVGASVAIAVGGRSETAALRSVAVWVRLLLAARVPPPTAGVGGRARGGGGAAAAAGAPGEATMDPLVSAAATAAADLTAAAASAIRALYIPGAEVRRSPSARPADSATDNDCSGNDNSSGSALPAPPPTESVDPLATPALVVVASHDLLLAAAALPAAVAASAVATSGRHHPARRLALSAAAAAATAAAAAVVAAADAVADADWVGDAVAAAGGGGPRGTGAVAGGEGGGAGGGMSAEAVAAVAAEVTAAVSAGHVGTAARIRALAEEARSRLAMVDP